ncbi:heterokaryon incompatibility protein-domain-containing protein [Paraphoma chrysanthemicola]|uniref:Heterokaryon incompatibility protein-domain-containing protein n=1 Tax=Paraphoma chrysanthemicola TaxID=798071 RepID=A0A8K0QWU9_9PLEO|nr:heterokaryon incompatibility protein-domain-containing protein [Paraphoma chrysanthemicola]
MSAQVYSRLPTRRHVRLLSLLPLSSGPEITVQTFDSDIDSLPAYEALSYVWGDVANTRSLKCNESLVTVTECLHSALHHLRQPENARVMWIDAICINQDDLEERSFQVTLMRDIYLRASAVIVWLGPHQEETEAAWETIQCISRDYEHILEKKDEEVDWYSRMKLPNLDLPQQSSARSEDGPEMDSLYDVKVCSEIARILRHPWFTRSWVVQEAACARRLFIRCGVFSMTWKTLRTLCCFLRERRGPGVLEDAWQEANSMVLLQDTLRVEVEDYSAEEGTYDPKSVQFHKTLSELLPATRHLQATDPHDKIFAFLGLCDDTSTEAEKDAHDDGSKKLGPWSTEHISLLVQRKSPFLPNYFNDIKALYCTVTKRLLGPTLFMLSHAAQSPTELDLPSWVPDWRTKVEMIVLGRIEVELKESRGKSSRKSRKTKINYRPFQASKHSFFRLNLHTDLEVLALKGRVLDTIKEVRADIWLTDFWDMSGCLVDLPLFQDFLRKVCDYMIQNYNPELAHQDARKTSRWVDDWTTSFKVGRYDASSFAKQCDSLLTTHVDKTRHPSLEWPAPGYLQDFLRIQTANLRLSDSEFRPGHPGWHYLSTHISPSGTGTRGGPVNISSDQMPQIIPPGYFAFAAKVRVKRKIFCTTKGYIGICPEWAQAGDWLYFAEGGDVPFVLRQIGQDRFRLIGESYCHGLMSGQITQVVKDVSNVLLV